jgi:hypothetical protein
MGDEARLLIEQAEAHGEPPEDPLLLFSVLYGFLLPTSWLSNGFRRHAHNGRTECRNELSVRRQVARAAMATKGSVL